MQLTDVGIDRFASLSSVAIGNISSRVTVFFSAEPASTHGPASTAFVEFVRGLFYGCRCNSSLPHSDQRSVSGFARVRTSGGQRTLRRSWMLSGLEQFSVTDEQDRYSVPRQDNHLPAWVTEDVFREICSAGPEDVDRFDLLVRLCIESAPDRSAGDPGIRHAELALEHTVRERDGNGIQGGVVHRISELRRCQGELQGNIAALRRPAGDLPAKIEQLVRETDAISANIDRIEIQVRETDAGINRLKRLPDELRRRNVLPLNRLSLEAEIRAISVRLDHWRDIRSLIARETESLRLRSGTTLHTDDSIRSIRAIVSRLEERTQALTDRLQCKGVSDAGVTGDREFIRLLRGETAALCQYFCQLERTTTRHMESLQLLFADRSMAEATQLEWLLEQHLATLKAELSRADNVLAESAVPSAAGACRFSGHQEPVGGALTSAGSYGTVAEVEAQILNLQTERSRLVTERAAGEDSRTAKRILLERLRQELSGAAMLEQLDVLRARIAELDAGISLLEDQRRQLDRTEASLREVIGRLKNRSLSGVFELASRLAQHLTDGECRQISATKPDQLMIHTAQNIGPLSLSQLSRSTRDQVALALRLALIQIRSESHGHVPLLLNDIFVTSDDTRAAATVQLLTEIAQQGQQILFFTCRRNVRDLFARFSADVRTLALCAELPDPVMPPVAPPIAPVVLHAWIEPALEIRPVAAEPVVLHHAVPPQPVIVEPAQLSGATNWLFYLELDHGSEDLAGITLGELEALRSSGVLTIEDLLNHTVPRLDELTRKKGFTLSVDRLHALRGQAELTTRVPMLRRSDAALLFAAGVHSAEELSRLRPETVYDRVTEFQRSEAGSRFRRGGRLIDRQQAINWARFGQCSRSLEDARHTRSRFAARSAPGNQAPAALLSREGSASATSAVRGSSESDSQGHRRRHRRVEEDADTEQRRARRLARRRRMASRLRTEPVDRSTSDDSQAVERIGGMRFFLSRTSEIEKAPSIGPRTAQMLEAIGVRTVEEFLSMTSERLAEKLSHRRITAHVIQQWQAQSRMMCQIPELRGHDAQILVACGITTPEGLAGQTAADLYSVVEPFARSKDGERIIRKNRRPDLAEVTDWIQWAANARSMRAA